MNKTTNTVANKTTVTGGITMKTAEMKALVATKVAEMEELLNELLNNPELSVATKRTQKFQRETAIHTLKVFEAVLEQTDTNVSLTMDQEKWFKSMTTLTRDRKAASAIEFKEGDNFFEVMKKYPNKNFEQVEKAVTKAGYKLQGQTIVKA